MSIKLAAVGRPSNTGGIDYLKQLADRLTEREFIIVGEHDEKEDGSCPGKEGAIKMSNALAEHLGRSVRWCFPPDSVEGEESKDLRGWLNSVMSPWDAIEEHSEELREAFSIWY